MSFKISNSILIIKKFVALYEDNNDFNLKNILVIEGNTIKKEFYYFKILPKMFLA